MRFMRVMVKLEKMPLFGLLSLLSNPLAAPI